MSCLEKYLVEFALTDKKYSLSLLDEKDSFVLTVSDNGYKKCEPIKEDITLMIVGEYSNGKTGESSPFLRKSFIVPSAEAYPTIVNYMKECLSELNIEFNERLFDFSMETDYNTFNYVISDDENLFIRAEVDGKKIY